MRQGMPLARRPRRRRRRARRGTRRGTPWASARGRGPRGPRPSRRFDVARPGPRATAYGLRARLYLARRGSAPHVVGRGVPLGWTRRGTLVAARFRGTRANLDVRDETGRRLRVLARDVGTYV